MTLNLNNFNKYQIFTLIIFLNLIIRSIFFITLDESVLQFSDQIKYLNIAEKLLNEFTFNDPHLIARAPIYPLFIFFVRLIFDNFFFVILVQHLIGILSIFLVYNTCKLINKNLSLLTTLFYSINLNVILYQNLLLTEAIFVNVFIGSIYFLLKFLKYQKIKFLIYLSLSLAISALIRPQMYYFYIIIFLIIFFLINNNFKEKIKFFLIFIFIFKSCLFIWEYRNYKVHGNYFFVIVKEANLVGYYLPFFDQHEFKLNLEDAKNLRVKKYNKYIENLNNKEINNTKHISELLLREKIVVKYAIEELFKYKISTFLQVNIFGSLKTILAPTFIDIGYFYKLKKNSFSFTKGNSFIEQSKNFINDVYNNETSYFIFFVLSLLLILVTRLVQLYGFIIYFKKNPKISIIIVLIISFYLILLGPLGAPKYRIPFELFFSYYLSYGLLNIIKILKK
tara:strand:- start:1331 stop:2683 length:1353 start_codon:yes stop_codon:yes gene_type:complete